jgi:CTP:molybdopterin cytidylyltransferase MocA
VTAGFGARLGGVVLAGGEGKRMGRVPKAGLQIGRETLLERAVRSLRQGGCETIVAILPAGHAELVDLAEQAGVTVLFNPAPADGMFSSARIGLAHLLAEHADVAVIVIFPVDHPEIQVETIATLVSAAEKPRAAAVRPSYSGRSGHPLVVTRALAEELTRVSPAETLREALTTCGARIDTVSVVDPGVLVNVNTPGDLERLQ